MRNRQYEAALTAADAARDITPLRPEPDDVRGRAFLALKRYEEAEEAFNDFLRQGGAAGADVYKGRGQARMQLGKYLEAVEDYSLAVERQPDAG